MPARLRDLIRALAEHGVHFERPSAGSHWKARNAAGLTYPIPAGNAERTEIDDVYIKKLCRNLGVDYDALKREL